MVYNHYSYIGAGSPVLSVSSTLHKASVKKTV